MLLTTLGLLATSHALRLQPLSPQRRQPTALRATAALVEQNVIETHTSLHVPAPFHVEFADRWAAPAQAAGGYLMRGAEQGAFLAVVQWPSREMAEAAVLGGSGETVLYERVGGDATPTPRGALTLAVRAALAAKRAHSAAVELEQALAQAARESSLGEAPAVTQGLSADELAFYNSAAAPAPLPAQAPSVAVAVGGEAIMSATFSDAFQGLGDDDPDLSVEDEMLEAGGDLSFLDGYDPETGQVTPAPGADGEFEWDGIEDDEAHFDEIA